MIAANRARALAQAQGHAVSLTQLPPPIEADSDDEVDTGSMPSYIGELTHSVDESLFAINKLIKDLIAKIKLV